MLRSTALLIAVSLALGACSKAGDADKPPATTETAMPAAPAPEPAPKNPFTAASTLPFEAPAFDKITDADYQPAIEEGIKQHAAEIRKIADNTQGATFENTIEAMQRSGAMLTRVSRVFFSVAQANNNPTLQKIQADVAPLLANHSDEIFLDPKLFARVKAIYEARETLNFDPQQLRLVEHDYEQFVRAGAQLSDADKASLRELNVEESKLSTDFSEKLLAATKEGALIVDDKAKLAGFSEADVAAAAAAATERTVHGKFVVSLQNTTNQPALASLSDRDVRAQLLKNSEMRASRGDGNDTRALVQRLAQLRAQQAKLLGFPNYATYALGDQMAQTPEAAMKLLTDTVPAATAKARGEAAKMQKVIDAQKGDFTLTASDWDFYAEQVRKAEFDLDEAAIRPYFELNRVLNDGVFFAANQLYGLTFKERKDLPVYQPDVRVFDVFDKDGTPLALFYADFFKRDSKAGGAWMDVFVEQNGLTGTKPVVFNVCNFTKPADGQPALLSFDDVTTMFHEFGHALHGMFSNVKYPGIAGTAVPRDFVEFPSQFNEHWASDPKVFANFAKHYQTGEPMPPAMVVKIKKAGTFNQGYATTEYLASALLDLAWHTLPTDAPMKDADVFEAEALKRFNVDMAQVPPRYRTPYFAHIWGGGYSAGYYAYFWSEVLDDDAFEWFKENGGMTAANGQIFRDKVLSIGNSQDLKAAYRGFRGKDPVVGPLLENRGLK